MAPVRVELLVGHPAHDERVVVAQFLDGQRRGLGVEAGPPFGRLDDAVERDEGRFDQLAHCGSLSRVVDLVITGPASDGPGARGGSVRARRSVHGAGSLMCEAGTIRVHPYRSGTRGKLTVNPSRQIMRRRPVTFTAGPELYQ